METHTDDRHGATYRHIQTKDMEVPLRLPPRTSTGEADTQTHTHTHTHTSTVAVVAKDEH